MYSLHKFNVAGRDGFVSVNPFYSQTFAVSKGGNFARFYIVLFCVFANCFCQRIKCWIRKNKASSSASRKCLSSDLPCSVARFGLATMCFWLRASQRPRFDPWVRKIPWRRAWHPTLVFFPGESLGERSLVCRSPWGPRVRHG